MFPSYSTATAHQACIGKKAVVKKEYLGLDTYYSYEQKDVLY